MKKTQKNIIKTIIFVIIGIVLFYFVYKDYDWDVLLTEIKLVNYYWFIPMFIMVMLSHISRAVRWQMLLESDRSKTKFWNVFFAVLNGYFANIAIPRLGEVTRCAIVSKYDKQNFSKVLGTMITERLTDIIMLLLITISAFLLQSNEIKQFVENNPNLGDNLDKLTSIPFLIIICCIFGLGLFLIIRIAKGRYNKFILLKRISDFINNFWNGFISLKNIKKPLWFIFHSVFIWIMYFIVLYICFFAFEGFENLGILAALTLFVAGSFGMVAPAPNGVGAYHFMIIQTLLIYGISQEKAAAFALVVHGMQTLILIIMGLASFILIPIFNKDK